MSDEWIQVIAAAIVTVAQLYVIEPWKFPVFAIMWDIIATITGVLADILGKISLNARINYFTSVQEAGT